MRNPGLTRTQWIGILLALLAVFLFAQGPIWRHPWNVDRAAWWSYVPIPLLVAACLAWKRRLRWIPMIVDTIGITLTKFAITYLVSIGLWIASGGPPPRPAFAATAFARRVERPMPPPESAQEAHGTIEGRVLGPGGAGVEGAVVWIASGLEGIRFPAPRASVRLVHDGRLHPEIAVVEVGQPLDLAAGDGRLHTLRAHADSGPAVFNVPVLPGGAARPFVPREAAGLVRVDCAVHPDEPRGWLVVTANPFHATTQTDGSFRLERVPARRVTLAAWRESEARQALDVEPDTVSRVVLAIGR